ncbi:hypothetical protein PY247_11645 [Acinetobacter proteolyticus]|nr:hypothetical protein [Acinetobacter proteolyticus]WEI17199.1 hypothetical protein PY247_11645 [Acinetobacter proteolyticus]
MKHIVCFSGGHSSAWLPLRLTKSTVKKWSVLVNSKKAIKGGQFSLFSLPNNEKHVECMGDCGIERYA